MPAQTVQLRVTLPAQLQAHLQAKASQFGLNMSVYVKNLILNDVKNMEYPTFEMSSQSIRDLEEAKKEEQSGKLIKVSDVSTFLKNL